MFSGSNLEVQFTKHSPQWPNAFSMNSCASSPLSAPKVTAVTSPEACLVSTTIALADSGSGPPFAVVTIVLAISPWRMSLSVCPMRRNWLAVLPWRYSRASVSVLDSCVSLLQRWPLKLPGPAF